MSAKNARKRGDIQSCGLMIYTVNRDDIQRRGVDYTVGAIHESPVCGDSSATLGMTGNEPSPMMGGEPFMVDEGNRHAPSNAGKDQCNLRLMICTQMRGDIHGTP